MKNLRPCNFKSLGFYGVFSLLSGSCATQVHNLEMEKDEVYETQIKDEESEIKGEKLYTTQASTENINDSILLSGKSDINPHKLAIKKEEMRESEIIYGKKHISNHNYYSDLVSTISMGNLSYMTEIKKDNVIHFFDHILEGQITLLNNYKHEKERYVTILDKISTIEFKNDSIWSLHRTYFTLICTLLALENKNNEEDFHYIFHLHEYIKYLSEIFDERFGEKVLVNYSVRVFSYLYKNSRFHESTTKTVLSGSNDGLNNLKWNLTGY